MTVEGLAQDFMARVGHVIELDDQAYVALSEMIHDELDEVRKLLNAWHEVGDEMRRIVDAMSSDQREDLLPDWFDARLRELEGKHW